ncbi:MULTISPECIES: RNA-guided endonuclease TnpB family protein [Moorena]|nr:MULTISPECIES: RNA-guided endonuclease TnpB family protein [Moorena]NEP67025.1 IS200/IS605 family element transposase accessory protein TnpB [Moorena sp. SIO3A5]NEQ10688.1 IS200/IS605 family element transposase accessory protein TnpB [Moorena sp. SIO4E2]NER88879.1 IS200/IS605 family element transposase accessory protein TnpB [Moorena sp. SIO3A2]NES42689.1 IS200/IS605 family element transposase accessory protein TnpB [Moorena sp. SIO2C4]OLT69080.1 transposase [Moorena producens 3L]
METTVLTIVCKIQPTPQQADKIEATLKGFADACNYTNAVVKSSITSKNTIQAQVYKYIRETYNLSANLAVRVCGRVAANRKTAKHKNKPVSNFSPTSADYDARIFSYREKDQTVSLTLVGGRERFTLQIGNYQIGKLKGKQPTSAQLCKHRDGQYYVHIQVKEKAPLPQKREKVIGVDLGRTEIAVTSENLSFSGKQVTETRDKFARVRRQIQQKASKGTRSSRRRCRQLQKRLSGKERRFQTWVNHNVSKAIVESAKSQGAVIALEDLTGIRERTNLQPRSKTEKRRSNSWAFYQLREFIRYKALEAGVEVIFVNPRYTSQTCHKCLHIHPVKGKSYRSRKRYKCSACGWIGDADFNGSMMIKMLGQSVTLPGGSYLSCSLTDIVQGY